jgi:hypothetical protein
MNGPTDTIHRCDPEAHCDLCAVLGIETLLRPLALAISGAMLGREAWAMDQIEAMRSCPCGCDQSGVTTIVR